MIPSFPPRLQMLLDKLFPVVQKPLSVEDLCTLYEFHVEREDYAAALRWIQSARKLAPTSVDLMEREADVLAFMGKTDEATVLWQLAHAAGSDSAAYHAALHAERAHDVGRLKEFLLLAIERDPDPDEVLLFIGALDPSLHVVARDPEIKRAIRRARKWPPMPVQGRRIEPPAQDSL